MIALIACVAVAATGCGTTSTNGAGGSAGDAGSGGSPGTGGDGGMGGGGMGGEGGAPGTSALPALDEAPTFAVVSSDFSESSIATLDADFEILSESWIDSGTTYPGLVATLSGDVDLPTTQQGGGTFTFIDRFFTDVVSQFYVPSGNLNGQTRTQNAGADYSSNPHDFIAVSETSAWVTRYEPNLDPMADEEDAGTDLIELDPSSMTRTGRRIDLSEFDTTGTAPGDVELDVYARPDRGVVVGSTLVVGLDRLSSVAEAAGPGLAAIIDLEDESVEGLPLGDGIANCGNVTPVPGSPDKVVIGCVGFANPFGDAEQTRASAGFVLLDVGEDGATIETTWRASSSERSSVAVNNHVVLDASRVVGVQFGGGELGPVDEVQITDIETGEQTLVYEATGAFQLGQAAYDPTTGRLYVPNAPFGSAGEVLVFEVTEDEVTPLDSVTIDPGLGFSPRSVYYLP
jgi:hypothetical protein